MNHRVLVPSFAARWSSPVLLLALACSDSTSADGDGDSTTADDDVGSTTTDDGEESSDANTGTSTLDETADTSTETDTNTTGGECMPGEEQCKDGVHQTCEDGTWQDDPCPDGSYCDERSETCVPCVCEPGTLGNCVDSDNVETCLPDCSGYEAQPCDMGVCIDGACVDLVCPPDALECVDDDSFHLCNGDGTQWGPTEDCDPGDACLAGQCVSSCELAAAIKSNVGCEFWAVDMSNLPPRNVYTFAVAISNPSFDDPASITIYDRNGGNEQMLIQDTVAPRDVKVFNLSGSHAGYTSYYNGQDAGFQGNGIGKGRAFRVASDQPVVATQFNPIGGASGFTTDASLLLPTHTLGEDYIHLDWDRGYGDGAALVIVATEEDTTVTVTPTVNTAGGINGLPAMTAGVPTQVALDRYDFIQIGVNDLNLTGSTIAADKAVAVFGGHACANVPTESIAACDHVEEQIFPLETWGTDYVASRNPIRGGEPMRWRIVAAEDNTTVDFDPPVSLGAQIQMNAGEWVQFDDMGDFSITANDPILVAGYMYGCQAVQPNNNCPGDPYMALMVPVEQYQQDYVFLVDDSYDQDYAKLVRPSGAEVTVECLGVVPENRWTPIGNSGYDWATIDMNPGEAMCQSGTNQANSPEKFGIIVLGQSAATSYAYPGGLALDAINPQ
jgi:hypothetical protein